jgi:hypothetical protein
LEYDFSIIYKPRISHFVVDALSQCLISQKKVEYWTKQWRLHSFFHNQCGYRKFPSTSLSKNLWFITIRSKRKS